MLLRALWIVTLILAAVVGLYCVELATPQRDYFIERPGTLARYEVVANDGAGDHRQTLRLESSSGLQVDLRVLRPANDAGQKLPLLLIVGGHRTGKDAVELVGEAHGVVYAAIDYPYHGKRTLNGFTESVSAIPAIQRAFLDTPPALSLALEWLLQQPWVDPNKTELLGVSLGVPFAAVAGALDHRFKRVWLIHGGGDNRPWVMHAARKEIENETLRRLAVSAALFVTYGHSFDTASWMQEIAPRPLIIVAARNDDRVPAAAQLPLIEAAENASIELIWTEGQHIGPGRENELQQIVETVLRRIDTPPDP